MLQAAQFQMNHYCSKQKSLCYESVPKRKYDHIYDMGDLHYHPT